ncbi:MAG: hypothetical protein QS748_09375 [Candidatus Endonucleobacter bathymodioli]|uniref:Uncharacterized protein n=1 Tax=Candidatus Endonucleibacter bathymodioli TaxID=539814 RepID=A0AA90NM79_9GAMM|nr:hypothetical protein [Candidatus Endonucleobacter bathymodioli]
MNPMNRDQTQQMQSSVSIFRKEDFSPKKIQNRLLAKFSAFGRKIKGWTEPVRLIPKAYKEWVSRVKSHHVATHVFMACVGIVPWLFMAASDASQAYRAVSKQSRQREVETSTEIKPDSNLLEGTHPDADDTLAKWSDDGDYQGDPEILKRHLIDGVHPEAQELLDKGAKVMYSSK